MEDSILINLLNDLESDRTERKASINDIDRISEAICAFANDLPNHRQPGVVFIGVNDNGTCTNLSITDRLLLTLAELHSNGNVLPFPMMTVQKKMLNGCELAVIVVEPSDDPPVRFRGRTYVRVGPRRAIATVQEERHLSEKRRFRNQPYDIQPISYATVNDLDLELFRRVYLPSALPVDILEENHRSIEQQLASMRFTTIEPEAKPTTLGILVLGKDPRQFMPGAYIQFIRFDGTELTDPIKDQKEINGPLPDLLRTVDEMLQVNITTALDITTQQVDIRHPDYPIRALQQLARNAILHRIYEGTNAPVRIYWYANRIEIYNPGGPYGTVTRENFGTPGITDYRNPHLAEVMKNLGYVQRFGIGISLARQELEKNGNPPLEYTVEPSHVLATIRRQP
ncbi:MAG TPA: ATP-binding protein [Ktedonobacteraceae bacterium]|nr:ATP-binding protein [Ktedonobacteraceae bacterium]